MANTLLTPTMVTREALRVLHQKLNFVGNVNRQYDDAFAKKGAKIGTALNIRLPNQYTVRSGPTMGTSPTVDTTESSVQLNVTNQKGVDLNFTSVDLTMALDDFSDRIIQPAMAVLAANIESDAMNNMINDVYQQATGTGPGLPVTFNVVLQARKILNDSLAPMDNKRCCSLNTQDNIDLVDALKGLFQDSDSIADQYTEGMMGRTAGFNFYENTLWATHTVGTKAGAGAVNGASQTGSSLVTNGWTASSAILKKGDIITIAGVNKVHPETKVAITGATPTPIQQFVVTADTSSDGSGNATIPISPAIVVTGPAQNVTGSPANAAAITVAGTASTAHGISMAFHRDAFVFATADLEMPYGVDWASRQVLDGISMRIVRAYDINNDKFPCRLDVLYGYKTVRPQLACRLANR